MRRREVNVVCSSQIHSLVGITGVAQNSVGPTVQLTWQQVIMTVAFFVV